MAADLHYFHPQENDSEQCAKCEVGRHGVALPIGTVFDDWPKLSPGSIEPLPLSPVETVNLRKATPICTGVLDYFPDALAEIARVSRQGNEQHNPGQPLHWDKSKSTDEADALTRHLLERGTRDTDGMRHTAKVAWRALALLQRELDAEKAQQSLTQRIVSDVDAEIRALAAR